jgi:hypothetical protein
MSGKSDGLVEKAIEIYFNKNNLTETVALD